MSNVTFIISVARSRSFWLSQLLSTSGTVSEEICSSWHEPLARSYSLASLFARIDTLLEHGRDAVVADTSFVYLYEHLRERYPQAKYIFLLRDPAAIAASLENLGIDSGGVADAAGLLSSIIRYVPPPIEQMRVLNTDDLNDPDVLRNLYRFARGFDMTGSPELWINAVINCDIDVVRQARDPSRLLRLIHEVEPVSYEEQDELGVYLDDGSYADDPDMYTVYGYPEPLRDLPDCEMCSSESQEEEPRF